MGVVRVTPPAATGSASSSWVRREIAIIAVHVSRGIVGIGREGPKLVWIHMLSLLLQLLLLMLHELLLMLYELLLVVLLLLRGRLRAM